MAGGVQTQRNARSTPPLPRPCPATRGCAQRPAPAPARRAPLSAAPPSPCGKQPSVVVALYEQPSSSSHSDSDPTCVQCIPAVAGSIGPHACKGEERTGQRQTDRSIATTVRTRTCTDVVLCFSWIGTAVEPTRIRRTYRHAVIVIRLVRSIERVAMWYGGQALTVSA